ncbi:hypothetical protein V8C35DRAFT_319043 [Trichoderma chlorosporum]
MDKMDEEQMCETDLTFIESGVLSSIRLFLEAQPHLEWDQPAANAPRRCKTTALLDYTKPIKQQKYRSSIVIEVSPNLPTTTFKSGDLIPIYPFDSGSVSDGDTSHELRYGKRLHLPAVTKQRTITVRGDRPLYLLWLD